MAKPVPDTASEIAEKFFDQGGRQLLKVANNIYEQTCDYKVFPLGKTSDPAFKVIRSKDTDLVLSELYECVVLSGAYILSSKYRIVAPVGYVKDLISERFVILDRLDKIPAEDMVIADLERIKAKRG